MPDNVLRGIVRMEVQGAASITALQRQVTAFGGGVRASIPPSITQINNLSASLRKLPGSSNQATAALTNLSRVAQDAPFGFIGIANNLNPLLESFQRLRASTGSTGGALKALGSSLTGAGGIGLALGIGSALLTVFGDKLFGVSRAAKEAKEANDKLAEGVAGDIVKLTSLVAVIQNNNTSNLDRAKALAIVNEQYSKYLPSLEKEKITLGNISDAYDKIIDSLLRQAVVKGLQEEIEKAVSKTAASIISLQKAAAKTPEISPDLKNLNKSSKDVQANTQALNKDSLSREIAVDGYRKFNRVVSDGVLAQQRANNETRVAVGAVNNYETALNRLKGLLKKDLEPLFGILGNFKLDDLNIDEVKVNPKKAEIDFESTLFIPANLLKKVSIPVPFTLDQEKFEDDLLNEGKKFNTLFEKFIDKLNTDLQKLASGIKPPTIRLNKPTEDQIKAEDFRQGVEDAINGSLRNITIGGLEFIGEALGAALSGGDLEGIFRSFGAFIGDQIAALGKQFITLGVVAKAAKESLKTVFANPAAALAAGVALIAVGSALKAGLSKGIKARKKGGPVSPGEPYLVGEDGPEIVQFPQSGVVIPAGRTKQILNAAKSFTVNKSIVSNTSNFTRSLIQNSSGIIAGARQFGGSVISGLRYLTGETGRELFIPRSLNSGILPKESSGVGSFGTMTVRVQGSFIQSGRDMVAVIDQNTQSLNRYR